MEEAGGLFMFVRLSLNAWMPSYNNPRVVNMKIRLNITAEGRSVSCVTLASLCPVWCLTVKSYKEATKLGFYWLDDIIKYILWQPNASRTIAKECFALFRENSNFKFSINNLQYWLLLTCIGLFNCRWFCSYSKCLLKLCKERIGLCVLYNYFFRL